MPALISKTKFGYNNCEKGFVLARIKERDIRPKFVRKAKFLFFRNGWVKIDFRTLLVNSGMTTTLVDEGVVIDSLGEYLIKIDENQIPKAFEVLKYIDVEELIEKLKCLFRGIQIQSIHKFKRNLNRINIEAEIRSKADIALQELGLKVMNFRLIDLDERRNADNQSERLELIVSNKEAFMKEVREVIEEKLAEFRTASYESASQDCRDCCCCVVNQMRKRADERRD